MEKDERDDELKTYNLKEISLAYSVSERSLLRYVKRGDLKAARVGRRFQVTAANLKEFLRGKNKR